MKSKFKAMVLSCMDPRFQHLVHNHLKKKGLKTGMYYLRSRSAVDAVKVTVSSEKAAKDAYINTAIKQNNEPEDCETCSA